MKRNANMKNRETFLLSAIVLVGLLILNGVSGVVQAQTFSNAAPITIPQHHHLIGRAAIPYPSDINVSGLSEDIGILTVTLHDLSHTWPDDIDVLLVGPTGETVILMSDVGAGAPGVTNVNLTFVDSAPSLDNQPFISGTYSPTDLQTGDAFDSPAPAGPYATSLNALAGVNPNGTWSLYIMDDVNNDGGSVDGGWSITFVPLISYQGRLIDGNVAAEGDFDFEFKLYDDPLVGSQVGLSDLKDDVPVEAGLFTVKLFLGNGVFNAQSRWLEIGIRPGASTGSFTPLTPRQELTAAPIAHYALKGPYTGLTPVNVDNMRNTIGLNSATAPGDLMTWDGNNWVAQQPAVQHFSLNNMQPYLGIHFIIALQGIYPSRNSADPFIAEIILFAGNFAPRGWAFCDGEILAISSYAALFSLLGTTYGGDGEVTFALPDLRGRVPLHPGNGVGLTPRNLGETSGSETIVR